MDDELGSPDPAVAVTLNPLCGGSVPYTVELSFGVREKDSGEECLPQQNISATILPGASLVLPVNTTSLPLAQGQQYCYTEPIIYTEDEGESHMCNTWCVTYTILLSKVPMAQLKKVVACQQLLHQPQLFIYLYY